ncbi:hypothetical protein IQ07DRAFT_224812 [Pyrenochaeta sp. DS3sAY3a]|nr:hypothetical protein IQ07DRAFT_224812 [Pyrenochaeta sp. DS3sAY3a]
MMNYHTYPEQWYFGLATHTTLHPTYDASSPSLDLARLLHEKEVLEIGLAKCVASLLNSRKKQIRNERQLSVDPPPSRKKRKSIQHYNRDLQREIKNRERDERAFLSNLQACKANIYVAECLFRSQLDPSSILADISSSSAVLSTVAESEVTTPGWNGWNDWNGWTDDAVISPFQKESSNTSYADDVAPDDCINARRPSLMVSTDIPRPPPTDVRSIGNNDELPGPPNTAQSAVQRSTLSPMASPFEPIGRENNADQGFIEGYFDQLGMSPLIPTSIRRIERRGACITSEQMQKATPIQVQSLDPPQTGARRHTDGSITPRNRLTTGAGSGDGGEGRRRTRSLQLDERAW